MTRNARPTFDFGNINSARTELIIRILDSTGFSYFRAVIGDSVRGFLEQVLVNLQTAQQLDVNRPWDEWDYGNDAHADGALLFPWQREGVTELQFVLDADRLTRDANVLNRTDEMHAYFVRFEDSVGQKLIAVKEARAFKSLRRRRLAIFSDGELTMVEQPVFQLAGDFDFIYDATEAFVFSPKVFERLIDLDQHVADGNTTNIAAFLAAATFVNWPNITNFISSHKRGAKALRSIIARGELGRFVVDNVRNDLVARSIGFDEPSPGEFVPQVGHELKFLLLLDHSIYGVQLTSDPATSYVAGYRTKLS